VISFPIIDSPNGGGSMLLWKTPLITEGFLILILVKLKYLSVWIFKR